MKLQTLRTIDKFDKIGRDGVVELLQKPLEEFGANLDPIQAELIGIFLDTPGATDEEKINNIGEFFKLAKRVRCRIDLMVLMEEQVNADGKTMWDKLIAMRCNADQTWEHGGRPENIAWALDDIINALILRHKHYRTKV